MKPSNEVVCVNTQIKRLTAVRLNEIRAMKLWTTAEYILKLSTKTAKLSSLANRAVLQTYFFPHKTIRFQNFGVSAAFQAENCFSESLSLCPDYPDAIKWREKLANVKVSGIRFLFTQPTLEPLQ